MISICSTVIGMKGKSVVEGLDYAWGRPDPVKIYNSGRRFVIRYVSHDKTGKNLTLAEAIKLCSVGLHLVIVFESGASRMLSGFKAGATDAIFAAQQAAALGMPPDRPIYFACDFDATTGQQAAINDYLDGVASAIGRDRTGMYGGFWPISMALDAQRITWAWQTYAWSSGRWDARAQLRQYKNDQLLDGVSVDFDQSRADDYGQWQIGTSVLTDAEIKKVAIAVLNQDDVIPATDGSTTNRYWALRTHIYNIAVGVLAIQEALGEGVEPRPADTTAIIAGVLKGLDGGTGKGMIHQIIDGVTDGVIAGLQPVIIDYDLIADKVVERLARRMES